METTSARALATDLVLVDESGRPLFSDAHPIFRAPFTLIEDGGPDAAAR